MYDMVLAGFISTLINEIMCLNLRTGVEQCFGDFVEDIVSEKQGGAGLKSAQSVRLKGSGGINYDKVDN